jgi:hypothetical protein
LQAIAERQGISKKYLEIIVKDMVAGDLLVGASGKGGGVRNAAALGGVRQADPRLLLQQAPQRPAQKIAPF